MNQASTHRLEQLLTKILITADGYAGDPISGAQWAVNLNLAGEHFPSYTARNTAHDLLEDAVYAYWDLLDNAARRGFVPQNSPAGVLIAGAIHRVTADTLTPIPNLTCKATTRKLSQIR